MAFLKSEADANGKAPVMAEGTGGYYWTYHGKGSLLGSDPRSGYSLRFNSSAIAVKNAGTTTAFPSYSLRAYGYSVRPVQYN